MRIKFIPVIAFLLVFSVTIVSCLGDNDPGEYSPDATIRVFELDTIYGVNYKFTIDQLSNPARIFNADSVPVSADTIINKIFVKTLTTNAWVVAIGDTVAMNASSTDSLDFSKTMDEPMKIKVYAQDGTTKDYTIEVRRHKQDPDSLVWDNMEVTFPGTGFSNSKTVILGGQMLIYTSSTTLYSSPVGDGKTWSINTGIQGLPSNIKLRSLIKHDERLYIVSEDHKLFESADGVEWYDSALGGKVVSLLASLPTGLSAIVLNDDDKKIFAVSDIENGVWQTDEYEVPENFPINNISSTVYKTPTGLVRSVIVGTPEDGALSSQTVPWFTLMDGSMDGKAWTDMETDSEFKLPSFTNPTIMYYGDKLYAFGDGFETFYTSDTGIVWKTIDKKFMFPEEDKFKGRTNYSMVIDEDLFIWMIWNSQSSGSVKHGNEVWKGRLNKLGFTKP